MIEGSSSFGAAGDGRRRTARGGGEEIGEEIVGGDIS